jgi:predicted nucleic acid-binding protein
VEWLTRDATVIEDPSGEPPLRSDDPGDDHLIALAAAERAALVSGDRHLLALADRLPIHSAADFLLLLRSTSSR